MMRIRISEKLLEKKLRDEVTSRGGKCLKFFSASEVGYPDRLILTPGGRCAFVELKTTGEKPRPIQSARHRELRSLGFSVFIVDDYVTLKAVLNYVFD